MDVFWALEENHLVDETGFGGKNLAGLWPPKKVLNVSPSQAKRSFSKNHLVDETGFGGKNLAGVWPPKKVLDVSPSQAKRSFSNNHLVRVSGKGSLTSTAHLSKTRKVASTWILTRRHQ